MVAVTPLFRRLVLGGAFLAAVLVVLLPANPFVPLVIAATDTSTIAPNDPRAAADAAQAAAQAAQEAAEQAREVAREAREKAREAASEARDAAREARRSNTETVVPGVTIERGANRGDHKVRIDLPGSSQEFDSFDQFVDKAPAVAAGVVLMFLIAFLTPVIIIF
ncbi:MAG: hypothetical protein ABI777_11200, partial [Betaproteobacteria bacterium]